MRKCRKTRIGKRMFFLCKTILTILVITVIAGRPAVAYCDEADQAEKKFIVSYSAEKSSDAESDQGKMKIPMSTPVPAQSSEIYALESEIAVKKVAETRVKDLYPEKDGWINQKIEIKPY